MRLELVFIHIFVDSVYFWFLFLFIFWYFQCHIIQDLGCDIGFNKGKTSQTASEKGLLWLSKNKHFVNFCFIEWSIKNLKLKMQVWSQKWRSLTPVEKSTYAGMATSKEEHTYTDLQISNQVTRHISHKCPGKILDGVTEHRTFKFKV